MLETTCIACQYGFHDQHVKVWANSPGLMGGSRCVCCGECGDGRYKAPQDAAIEAVIETALAESSR